VIVGADNKAITKDDARNPIYKSSNKSIMYCIFRVDRKFYNLESVEGFEYHMERKGQVLNADATRRSENRILIGDANVYENLKQHIEGVWKRSDSCIARDLVLTTSHDFMEGIMKEDFERWINLNIEWLKKTYGDNCVYAVLHMDETTPHIHAMISPVYVNAKNKRVMSNKHFFDGKTMLSELQTNYANYIQGVFKSLRRGLKGSKQSHIDIKKFYGIVNKPLNEKDINSIIAKARNNELMEVKLNHIKKTLEAYKNHQAKEDKEKEELKQQNMQLFQALKEVKKEDAINKEAINLVAEFYKIPNNDIDKIISYCQKKIKEKERER